MGRQPGGVPRAGGEQASSALELLVLEQAIFSSLQEYFLSS